MKEAVGCGGVGLCSHFLCKCQRVTLVQRAAGQPAVHNVFLRQEKTAAAGRLQPPAAASHLAQYPPAERWRREEEAPNRMESRVEAARCSAIITRWSHDHSAADLQVSDILTTPGESTSFSWYSPR